MSSVARVLAMTNTKFLVGSGSTAVTAKARRGTRFKFILKAPAKVTIAITRRGPGVRHRKVGTLTRKHLRHGRRTIAFSGRIGKRALRPGAYKATLRARNAKGRSKPVAVKFSVVK